MISLEEMFAKLHDVLCLGCFLLGLLLLHLVRATSTGSEKGSSKQLRTTELH